MTDAVAAFAHLRPLVAAAVLIAAVDLLAATSLAAAQNLTGWWAGTAPDSGLLYDDGTCSQNLELVLHQNDGVVSGQLFTADTASGSCQSLLSADQAGGFYTARITGTLSGSILTLEILRIRTNEGVPNQLTFVLASGTADADQLATDD